MKLHKRSPNNIQYLLVAIAAFWSSLGQAQTPAPPTTIPTTHRLPSSAADTNKPGFVFNVSLATLNTSPNSLSTAESQLAGLYGDNLADPAAVGVASGPALPPNPSTAPISFQIPTVINVNRGGPGENMNRGDFTPNEQMPGSPGTDGLKNNIAGEALAYLDLPAGILSMGVISSTFFRVQIGGVTLGDQFGVEVGQMQDDNRRGGHSFNINVTQAGLYPARLIFENAGDSRCYAQWFTGLGTNKAAKILINDVAKGGIKAYQAVTTPLGLAYSRRLIPNNGQVNVSPSPAFHAELVDGSSAIDKNTVSAQLDGVAVTPSATSKVGNVTSVDFLSSTPLTPGVHTAALVYTEGANRVTNGWSLTVAKYVTLDPAWRVTPDATKPGFNWDIFANSDPANTANTIIRAEKDLSLFAVDATGASLPNLADPNAQGAALAVAAAQGR